MNHIYKVIWNKAKHCYTVVSEIAKNHSTSSVTKKKVSIAAILAAGMLSGFSPMVSGAANTTNSELSTTIDNETGEIKSSLKDSDNKTVTSTVNISEYVKGKIAESAAVVYDQNKTSLKSTNSNGVGKNAIALGQGASAVDDSIAIGNGASVVGGSNGKGGVALGKNAHAGYKGTSLGNSAISGREGTIVIGDMTQAPSLYSTVVGTNSTITTDDTAYTVELLGHTKSVNVQGAVSTSYGAHNTITNKGKVFSGVANSISGSANTVTNSNGVTIQGTGNTVSNAYKEMNIGWNDLWDFIDGDYSSLAKKDSGAIAIIGGGNTISDQLSSTVIGFGNTLKGENSTGVFTAGSYNTLTKVSNSLVMGDHNTLEGRTNVISLGNNNIVKANKAVAIGNGTTVEAEGGVAIGESSVAKGSHSTAIGNESNVDGDDGLAIGYKSKIIKGSVHEHGTSDATVVGNQSVIGTDSNLSTIIGANSNIDGQAYCSTIIGAKSSISWGASGSTAVGEGTKVYKAWGTALGSGSKVTKENGTALGTYSSVTVDDGVAIGAISRADRAAGELGYLADTDTTDTDITWKANKGAVSVGSSAAKFTRQITNVAAGTYDTDAVNVAQLKKALESIDVDAGTGIKVDKITKDGKTTYKISTNITGSTTDTDTTTVTPNQTNTGSTDTSQGTTESVSTKTGNTVTVSTETKATSFGADNNQKADVKPGGTLNINGDGSNILTSISTSDNSSSIKVELKKDITVDSVTAGDTSISTKGLTIKDGPSITKTGIDGGNQKVTGVAAGEISSTSKDAVNGSQLFATNQQVAQNAQSINKLGNRINKVGAGAAALAALHPLDFDPDDKWDFAAGYGNYNGENAAAIGAYYRPNEDTMFSVGGSFGNGENMVNAGVSLKLGQGNHVSTSKVAMAKEIKDLRKELEGLKSALLDVNAGKKLDTSKLQLFPDVPKNHWAYEYVSTLKGDGALTGYPDGEFKGDRPMTRYEFATMLYKAMLEGATLSDKILKEFAPELERFTVDTVHQDKDGKPTVERVRTVKAEK